MFFKVIVIESVLNIGGNFINKATYSFCFIELIIKYKTDK